MFIATVFTMAQPWKQPKRALTDEWTKKMWCMYTMEQYSAIRKDERPLAATQMGLEIITLSEVSQKEKDKHAVTYMWYLTYDTDGHIYETEIGSHTQSTELWLPRWRGGKD